MAFEDPEQCVRRAGELISDPARVYRLEANMYKHSQERRRPDQSVLDTLTRSLEQSILSFNGATPTPASEKTMQRTDRACALPGRAHLACWHVVAAAPETRDMPSRCLVRLGPFDYDSKNIKDYTVDAEVYNPRCRGCSGHRGFADRLARRAGPSHRPISVLASQKVPYMNKRARCLGQNADFTQHLEH